MKFPLNSLLRPQQELSHELLQQVLGAGAQQVLGAGAQHLGAGAQHLGAGAQQVLGAGAQHVGAGAQHPLPRKLPASADTPAQQTTARAAT